MTHHKSFRKLSEICHDSTLLNNLLAKTQYLNELNALVQSYLAKPLRYHVKVANYRKTRLILALDKAVWITELRYQREKLSAILKTHHIPDLTLIQWIVVDHTIEFV